MRQLAVFITTLRIIFLVVFYKIEVQIITPGLHYNLDAWLQVDFKYLCFTRRLIFKAMSLHQRVKPKHLRYHDHHLYICQSKFPRSPSHPQEFLFSTLSSTSFIIVRNADFSHILHVLLLHYRYVHYCFFYAFLFPHSSY